MADAKTAAEIEDILSSIRRLVSQDRPPAPVQHRPQILSRLVVEELSPPEAPAAKPSADILVLTPAQRVAPAPQAPAKVTPLKREVATWPESAKPSEPAKPAEPAKPQGRLHLDTSLAWEAEMGDPAPDLASLDWSSFTFARRPMAETYAARARPVEREVAEPKTPEVEPAPEPVSRAPVVEAEPVDPARQEEDSIFSEDVLRELVRDLIREQLQGDLGERITRNIRKLVKAEIARSLQVKALD